MAPQQKEDPKQRGKEPSAKGRHRMSKRRLELILIDTGILCGICVLMSALSLMDVSTLTLNGSFTIYKAFALYICIMTARSCLDMYNTVWRYANTETYIKLMVSDVLGGFVFFFIGRLTPVISLGAAYTLVTVLLIMLATLSSRFSYQALYAHSNRLSDLKLLKSVLENAPERTHRINIAIVGAGNIGATLAEELLRNPRSRYYPYCFIDKDPAKIGSYINGIQICPEDGGVVEMVKSMPVQEIVIALPDAAPEDKGRLYDLYQQTGCEVMLYDYPLGDKPGEKVIGSGRRELREFRIEDLLFRDTLSITSEKAKNYYKGKTVLVTGGGGSIGSELCRQIAALMPGRLVILDIYENNAYDIQQELRHKYGDELRLDTVIASVRDADRLDEIFAEVRPDVVFHAAAHKHVPLMEQSGCEAIKNNVFGTYNVANMAEKYKVKKFVLISSDKAVNPTNIMGASKRLCEMAIQCRTDSGTVFSAVRFGNVLGSNGSVIPLFKKQIEAGGPVTLTDKRIIRYFMTIPEAVGLVMEAGAMARDGELFVLDMGKPVKIVDLAESMIRLSGYRPYKDIEIREIGLRPGEKLYEELLMRTEELDRTENELIFIERDKGYSRGEIEEKLALLERAVSSGSHAENGHHNAVIEAIQATVPTYQDPEEVNQRAARIMEKTGVETRPYPVVEETVRQASMSAVM